MVKYCLILKNMYIYFENKWMYVYCILTQTLIVLIYGQTKKDYFYGGSG